MVRMQDRVLLLDNPAQVKRTHKQGGMALAPKILSRRKLKALSLGPKWEKPERCDWF